MNSGIEKRDCKITPCPLRVVRAQLRVNAAADAGPATVKYILNELGRAVASTCLTIFRYDTGRAPRCHIVPHVGHCNRHCSEAIAREQCAVACAMASGPLVQGPSRQTYMVYIGFDLTEGLLGETASKAAVAGKRTLTVQYNNTIIVVQQAAMQQFFTAC